MARVLFFALLAMCLVCLIQGAPAGEEPAAGTTAGTTAGTPTVDEIVAKTQEIGAKIMTQVEKAIQDFSNDPNVKPVLDGGKKMAEDIVARVQSQIQAVIPKTE